MRHSGLWTWCIRVAVVAVLGAFGPAPARAEAAGVTLTAPESAAFAALRRQLTHRRRRLVYNNDGNDANPGGVTTADEWLSHRYKNALDAQVDSVFYCTGATIMVTHLTEIGETYGKYVPNDAGGLAAALVQGIDVLKREGTDSMALATRFCHDNGLEFFFSHRINDIHDSMPDCIWELCTWKRENPQFLFGPQQNWVAIPDYNDPRRWWSGMDFEHEEVRNLLLAMHEEIFRKYDIDGIEIDYFRSPMFFKPNLTFDPATRAQIEILTGFQRAVRELAYREGNRRGRPILVAARVPMSKAACLHVGIDIERWLQQGLLDLLSTGGGYVPFTMPTRELVQLGHAYDVPVCPSISASGMRGLDNRYAGIESWRGAAANAWFNGADGIILFNLAPNTPQDPHFTQLGDPETLRYLDKRFAIDNQPVLLGPLVQGIVQTQILPVALDSKGRPRQTVLPVGDDVAGAAAVGRLKNLSFRVQYGAAQPGDAVELHWNGQLLSAQSPRSEDMWVVYDGLRPQQVRQGANVLRFRLAQRDPANVQPVTVRAVELDVAYE